MKTKRILFEDLEKEANYLARVFGISTEDVEKIVEKFENKNEKVMELTELPMGIIAKIVTFDSEIRYQALTNYGKEIGMGDLFPSFEQATLYLMYRADRNLIEAAERVLNV